MQAHSSVDCLVYLREQGAGFDECLKIAKQIGQKRIDESKP